MNNIKVEVTDQISETIEKVEQEIVDVDEREGTLFRFFDKLIKEHERHMEKDKKDVYILGMELYKK